MDYPKFIVSNQKEESIRIQRDNEKMCNQCILSTPDKKRHILELLFIFQVKTYVVGTQKNILNIYFDCATRND